MQLSLITMVNYKLWILTAQRAQSQFYLFVPFVIQCNTQSLYLPHLCPCPSNLYHLLSPSSCHLSWPFLIFSHPVSSWPSVNATSLPGNSKGCEIRRCHRHWRTQSYIDARHLFPDLPTSLCVCTRTLKHTHVFLTLGSQIPMCLTQPVWQTVWAGGSLGIQARRTGEPGVRWTNKAAGEK